MLSRTTIRIYTCTRMQTRQHNDVCKRKAAAASSQVVELLASYLAREKETREERERERPLSSMFL